MPRAPNTVGNNELSHAANFLRKQVGFEFSHEKITGRKIIVLRQVLPTRPYLTHTEKTFIFLERRYYFFSFEYKN